MKKPALISALILLLQGCVSTPEPYPNQDPSLVVQRARLWSDSLERYIVQWTEGLVPASIPDNLIPKGISDSKKFYLKNPDNATAAETWAVRFAKPINKDSLLAGIPDPKITYLFLGTALAPFGSKLVIEGEFPHCRFFSVQIAPPLNGKQYYAQRQFGTAEVSVVDADIEPLPGHTNPFRVGANRNASKRSYKLEFDLTTGDPTALNDTAHRYPYRAQRNTRKGAMLVYQGPLGYKTVAGTALPVQGDWDLGCLWLRIYEPDDKTNALGGVPMPRVYFQLPNGKKYFIGSNFSALQRRADTTIRNRVTSGSVNPNFGPETGWYKSWGITRSMLNGVHQANGWSRKDNNERIRNIDLGWTGRLETLPPPANIEPHATTNNYCTYLGRNVTVEPGMVAVLTGKLPTFPATRNGEATMQPGQMRYWSICGIDVDPFSPLPATTIHAISDDDLVLDSERNYVIAYSRLTDRPSNATAANGVSWVDWGTQTDMGLLMRWVNVAPDWRFPLAPQEHNLDFQHSDWAAAQYDSSLIGINWRNGFLQCYLPRVHYLTRAEFEALGNSLKAGKIPVWLNENYRNGPAESRLGLLKASSVLDNSAANQASNANDGNIQTAWSSALGGTAGLTLDLGSVKTVSGLKMLWDFILFSKNYTVETSQDGSAYEMLIDAKNQNGNTDLFKNLPPTRARYLRLNARTPNLAYFRLVEMEVYTTDCDCNAAAPPSVPMDSTKINFRLSPNPTRNFIRYQIQDPVPAGPFQFEIRSIYGVLLKSWISARYTDSIDVSGLTPQTYVFTVRYLKQRRSARFVKGR